MVKKKDSVSSEHMEDVEGRTFKKDKKPYLVFPCTKCGQYSYVNLTQKGKKCLRCGRTHQVSKIKDSGEVVNGISAAVESVKKRQNELAIEDLGRNPDLLTSQSFKKTKTSSFISQTELEHKLDKYAKFKRMLAKRTKRFSEFPKYVIKLVAEEFELSRSELEVIIKKLLREEFLIKQTGNMFKIT